MPRWLST